MSQITSVSSRLRQLVGRLRGGSSAAGAAESDPHDPELWLARARAAEQAGDVRDAVAALFHVADLFFRAGLRAHAAGPVQRILELEPNHGGARRFQRMLGGLGLGAVHDAEPAEERSAVPLVIETADADELLVGDATARIALDAMGRPRAPVAAPPPAPRLALADALAEAINTSPLLSLLDSDALRDVSTNGGLIRRAAGEVVFTEGSEGASVFVVLRGAVAVENPDPARRGEPMGEIGPGAFFGEVAFLTGARRSATVVARSDTDLLEIPGEILRPLVARNRRAHDLLMRHCRARLVATLLASSPLFQGLSRNEHRAVIDRLRLRRLPPDAIAIRQGEHVEGLYFVVLGRLEVLLPGGGATPLPGGGAAPRVLGRLGRGDVFGEMSLLDGGNATATVRTLEAAWVFLLPRRDFGELIATDSALLLHLADVAAERKAQNQRA